MIKPDDRVKIKDYSQWDNLEPFKRLVKRYESQSSTGVFTVQQVDARGYAKISARDNDTLQLGHIYVRQENIQCVSLVEVLNK